MLQNIWCSLTFAIIYVSLLQEGAAVLPQKHVYNEPQVEEKDYVMDVATENNGEFGAENQQSEFNGEKSSGSSFTNKESQEKQMSAQEKIGAKQQEDLNTAYKETNKDREQTAEKTRSEASDKYHDKVGSSQHSGYNSALREQRKEKETADNSVERANTDTFQKRLRQKSSKKYAGKPGYIYGGRRWKSKIPRPWYGPYHVKRPLYGYGKRAKWCKLYKARLRYLLMGYHKRHLGHFLPFGLHYPSLKKYKQKSAYSEEQNQNKNVNINNNINNNHKTKERNDYQESHDDDVSSRVEPKYKFKTNMEKDAYNEDTQRQDYDKSNSLQYDNSKYSSGSNQNENDEYNSQAEKQENYSGLNQAEQQSEYNGNAENYKDAEKRNYMYDKNRKYEEPYEMGAIDEQQNKHGNYEDSYGREPKNEHHKYL